ncbi:hypothetical protein, partial [Methylobacterium sp. GC_Met_3]|uniref:hypothetical protein n=1 Tax=Methylobacterium sp. GC_Met_3 TaxID=2937375 RepID=UPI002269FC54
RHHLYNSGDYGVSAMSRVPFNIRGQLETPSSREEISKANAETIRDETTASQVDFDERTVRLKSLRLARDANLKERGSAHRVGSSATPRTRKG